VADCNRHDSLGRRLDVAARKYRQSTFRELMR
jgi:hypothetical protein